MGNQIPPNMVDMILQMLRGLTESDEFFETVAIMMRKLFIALMEVGFTEDQAIKIVSGFAASKN